MAEINIRELNYGTEGRFFPETHKLAVIGLQKELDNKANTEGNFPKMSVGSAQRIEDEEVLEGTFFSRPTGGYNAEISNGLASVQGVKGNSVKFNQLMQNGNFVTKEGWGESFNILDNVAYRLPSSTYSYVNRLVNVIPEHKYYLRICVRAETSDQDDVCAYKDGNSTTLFGKATTNWSTTSRIFTASSINIQIYVLRQGKRTDYQTLYAKNVNLLDLTALGIDTLTTVEQVEQWLKDNVGEQPYYAYNEGSVVNVNMTGIESVSKNLLNPTTGKAQIIGNYCSSGAYQPYYGIVGTYTALSFTDKMGNTSTPEVDADGKFLLNTAGELTVTGYDDTTSVFMWYDGSETTYTPYKASVGRLDVTHIYGKKNGTGDLVQVWPTGVPGIGTLKDTLSIEDGAVVAKRVVGEVDLGSKDYTYRATGSGTSSGSYPFFYFSDSTIKSKGDIICSKYNTQSGISVLEDKIISTSTVVSNNAINIRDMAYTDATTFRASLNGVKAYYELATPETYTDLVYQGSEYFEDGTPVTLPNYEADNWGIENILPMNNSTIYTSAPTLTTKYSLDIVEVVDTMNSEITSNCGVISEAIAKLQAEIDGLKYLLDNYNNSAKFKSVDALEYLEYNSPRVLIATGIPSSSLVPTNWDEEKCGGWNGGPRFEGQIYIANVTSDNTTTTTVYIARSATSSVGDWVALN